MCYNFNTSILSYSLGLLSSFFAFYTGQYILATLILFYCQMQLSEAIIWKGIDSNNLNLNKAGTTYGKYLLATHNIGIGLGIIISILAHKQKLKISDFIPLIIGILFFIFVVLYFYRKNDYENVTFPLNK